MASLRTDPRHLQLGILSTLLAYGLLALDFEVRLPNAVVIVAVVLSLQGLGARFVLRDAFDPRSALITALSLALLLRTGSVAIAALAAGVAIGTKLVVRVRGKHVFNPANIGLVAALATGEAWVSPGQWGSAVVLAAAVACLGVTVLRRSRRSDVTIAFAAAYAAFVLGRAVWLGDPLAVPLHRLTSGTLVVFAFFMISDPRTTPDARAGRVAFAALVAALAFVWDFVLYHDNGPIWALAACAPLVPIIDRWLPARRFVWPAVDAPTLPGDIAHVPTAADPAARHAPAGPGARILRLLRREGRHGALQRGLEGGAGPRR